MILFSCSTLNIFSYNTLFADDCFSCLPPYAGWLTSTEKANYDSFVQALRQGYVQLQSVQDDRATQWVRKRVYLCIGRGGVICCLDCCLSHFYKTLLNSLLLLTNQSFLLPLCSNCLLIFETHILIL
jgi:hypothetical protein